MSNFNTERERKRGIEIVDMLAAEGATYSEANLILKSAEYELSKRKYVETKDKAVAANNAQSAANTSDIDINKE